jgi:FixJ family two-component response regulator
VSVLPPTVLLVDDDQLVLDMLTHQLRSEGCRILSTTDPKDAPDILWQEDVAVLVADVDMPGMSGLDLVSNVRVAFPGVARILLTGQTSSDVVVDAINRGQVFRYLKKPCMGDELREAVRGAVQLAASLRRHATVERAVARRARTLDHVERLHPEIRHIPRTDDGSYALPCLGALLGEPHRSHAILALRELLEEQTSTPSAAPGLDSLALSSPPLSLDRVTAPPDSLGGPPPVSSARRDAIPPSSLGAEERRAFEESNTHDVWPVRGEPRPETIAAAPVAAGAGGRSSTRSAPISTTSARLAAVAAPDDGRVERETQPDRPRAPGRSTTPSHPPGDALARTQASSRLDPALLSVATPLRGTEPARRPLSPAPRAPLAAPPPVAAAAPLARVSVRAAAAAFVFFVLVALLLLRARG